MKISIKKTYEYLFILMLFNNWCGDLRIFSEIYSFIKPILLALAIMLAVTIIIKKTYTANEFVFCVLLLLLGNYTSYITENRWILYFTLLVALAKETNNKRILTVTYKCMSVFLMMSVFIFIVQYLIFPNMLTTISHDGVTKYDMTFIGANEAARYWIYWVLLAECIDMNIHMDLSKRLLIVFGTLFFYTFTRSDALLTVAIIVLLKYMKKNIRWERFVRRVGGYTFPIIWIMSLLILKFPETKIFFLINTICTGRLLLGITALHMYGISAFGRYPLEFYQWVDKGAGNISRLVVDNAYHMIMIQYGIVYLLIISLIFIKTSKRSTYEENICFIIYSLFALAENVILSPTAMFPVIIAANTCWNRHYKVLHKKWECKV